MTTDDLIEQMEELYEMLFYGLGIAELGLTGAILVGAIIVAIATAVVGFVVSLVVFILEAIPLYKISRKMGRKNAWLVWLSWLPVIGGYFSAYVLADIPGDKPVKLVGKVEIKSRSMSFWMYTGIGLFGSALITAVIGIINVVPVIGQIVGAFASLLYLVPAVAMAWLEYVYLRDVLDIFSPDRKANNTAAIVVAVLDALVTFGLARAFYLYTVMNKAPLPREPMGTYFHPPVLR